MVAFGIIVIFSTSGIITILAMRFKRQQRHLKRAFNRVIREEFKVAEHFICLYFLITTLDGFNESVTKGISQG